MGTEDSRRNRNGQFIFNYIFFHVIPTAANLMGTILTSSICLEREKLAFLKHYLCTENAIIF